MAITNPSPWHATVLSIFLAGQLSDCSSKVVNLGDNSSPNSQVQVPRDAGMPDYGVLQKDFNIGGIAIEPGHLYWQAATFNPPSMGGTSSTTFLLRSMGLGQDAGSTSSYTLYSIPQIGGYDNNSGQLRIDGDWLYWPSHDYSTNSDGVSRCSKSDCSTSEFLGNIGAVGSLVVQNGTVYWLAPDVSNQVTSLYRCEAANCVATKTQIPMNAPPGAVVYTRSSGLYVDEMFLYTADFGPVVSTGLQVGRILRVPKDGSGPFQVIAPGSWGFLMNEDTVFWEQLSTDEKILSIVSCPKSGCLGQPTTLMATLTLGLNTLNLLSIDSS